VEQDHVSFSSSLKHKEMANAKALSQLELSLASSQSEWRVVLPYLPLRFSADFAPCPLSVRWVLSL
jgi:hypothetical protein